MATFWRVVRQCKGVEPIATGTALGVFIGLTPTFGFQMPIAFAAATLLKENRLAAILGVWVTNPITATPIYVSEFHVGRFLLGFPELNVPAAWTWESLTVAGSEILLPFVLGSLFCAVFFGGITHAAVVIAVPRLIKLVRPRRAMSKFNVMK